MRRRGGGYLEEWLLRHTKSELLEMALEHRLPLAPVRGFDEVRGDPSLASQFVTIDRADTGPLAFPGPPSQLTGLDQGPLAPRPNHRPAQPRRLLPPFRLQPRGTGKAAPDRHNLERLDFLDQETQRSQSGPLSGYRILDFGWVLAGAIPGMVLADMGAEVIKVETRQCMDYMRLGRPIIGSEPDPEQHPSSITLTAAN